jgi:hypothetical protein
MNKRISYLLVAITFAAPAIGLAACSGDDTSSPGGPGVDSGSPDHTTAADTSTGSDTSPPPTDAPSDTAQEAATRGCSFAPDTGTSFQCDDPLMCASGEACCLLGQVKVDSTCGTLFGSKVNGTVCRKGGCQAGEVEVCSAVSQCSDAGVCGPFATKGKSLGACGISPVDAGAPDADAGDAGSCRPVTLHPSDGGVGPFCPFLDAGPSQCPFGLYCCSESNTSPEFCN